MTYVAGIVGHARAGSLRQRIRREAARNMTMLSGHANECTRGRRAAERGGDISGVWRLEGGARLELFVCDPVSLGIAMGSYERAELRFLRSFLRRGDVVVDVRAGLGLYSVIAGHCVGPGGRVFALEPSPTTFQRLRANVRINGLDWVECCNLGLSDKPDVRTMLTATGDLLGACNPFVWPILDAPASENQQVTLTTLDELARHRGVQGGITFAKICVEGWEERVLLGARDTLSRPRAPVLQVEFSEAAAQSAGTSCRSLYAALCDLGFTMFRIDASSGFLVIEPDGMTYPHVNLIAVRLSEDLPIAWRRAGVSAHQLRRHFDAPISRRAVNGTSRVRRVTRRSVDSRDNERKATTTQARESPAGGVESGPSIARESSFKSGVTGPPTRLPTVSIVVSAFHSEHYIRRFVRNVHRFAEEIQSFPWLSIEIVLVLNSPSATELREIRGLSGIECSQLRMQSTSVPRETLYASWNRGIALARGDVLGFWNVDDARFGAAVAEAAVAIHRGAQLVYFPLARETRWRKWGFIPQARRVVVDAPEFERDAFRRNFLIGPFFMFSRDLYGAVGPFDEQFYITGDLDWSLRAMAVTSFTRCGTIAGVFLNEWRGLSMSGSERAVAEHKVIYARHGLTDCLQPVSESLLAEYDEHRILVPQNFGPRS